jgi:hypothetical protein
MPLQTTFDAKHRNNFGMGSKSSISYDVVLAAPIDFHFHPWRLNAKSCMLKREIGLNALISSHDMQ